MPDTQATISLLFVAQVNSDPQRIARAVEMEFSLCEIRQGRISGFVDDCTYRKSTLAIHMFDR